MRHNVTTPGGFFVGLGGIVAFCIVSGAVYLWVKSPSENSELRPQQIALGLAAAPDAKPDASKEKEVAKLIEAAGRKYNPGGEKPDINNLAELRGVIRYREATRIAGEHAAALNAASNVPGKTVLEAAMDEVAKEIIAKSPAASKVALMEVLPDPSQPPSLPNVTGNGANTVQFTDPAKPAPAPAPATPAPPAPAAAPAAAKPAAPDAPPPPAPERKPLINSPEPK